MAQYTKTDYFISFTLVVLLILFGFAIGRASVEPVPADPTPEQCLSICVEEFQRMGC